MKVNVNGYFSKSQRIREVNKWLNSECYFHRNVYNESGKTHENRIIVLIESRFDSEWQKFNNLFKTEFFYLTFNCTMGGNYIIIEIR